MKNKGVAASAFKIFRFTLCSVIFVESVLTIFHAVYSETESHLGTVLPWFAGAEAIAALLMFIPATVRVAGAALLVLFLIALIVHGPAGQMSLFVYAAGVILLMAAGNATFVHAPHSKTGEEERS